MNINEKLTAIEINPNKKAEKVIIWLHGLGADGNDFAPIVPDLNLSKEKNIKFIFPNAPSMPVSINNGYIMPAWFDIYHADMGAKIDLEGIKRSTKLISDIIHKEIQAGITANNILIAGFSQGALIALTTALQYPEKLGGVIALSGLLPNADDVIKSASDCSRTMPVFIAHGTEDSMLPLHYGEAAYQALAQASYNVSWHTYPMAHGVCPEEIQDISNWIKTIWL